MTRPDEIAALADEVRRIAEWFKSEGYRVRIPETKVYDTLQKIAARLSATSPGDAVREVLEESKHWHERADKALSKSGRADADYHWRRNQHKEEIERIEAALAPAEKAGDDRHPVLYEFMPLSLVPLENPNHDPGEHQVMDSDTAYVFRICGSRERAENIVACLNAYAATPTPPSADVVKHIPTSNSDVAEALTQAFEYFDDRADVNDGDYGVPEPNREMRLAQMCEEALNLIQPAAHGGGTEGGEDRVVRHHYSPSMLHMGDCSICGNIYDTAMHIGSPADHKRSHSVGRSPSDPPAQEAATVELLADLILDTGGTTSFELARALLSTFNITRKL